MNQPHIIDGKTISATIRTGFGPRIARLWQTGINPGLAVILIGDDPASQVYVGMKAKAFAEMGLVSNTFRLSAEVTVTEVLDLVTELNVDPRWHGILIQLPLPSHLDTYRIIEAIDPAKDADGIHPCNIGRMVLGIEAPLPCTPHGILMLLQYSGITTEGRHVVILGRSNIVGKPIANLMLQKRPNGNATVTLCHTRTRDLKAITQTADILIAALGQPEFIDRSFIRQGAVVIDVGVNRIDDPNAAKGYRLAGDVNFADVAPLCAAITPVPGGVGPMTITMLIANTIYLAEQTLIDQKEHLR